MLNIPEYSEAAVAFRFFEEIAKIPHCSENCGPLADYLVDFARARGLEFYRDSSNNVVIRKPATPGYEGRPGVIFQGHLDMVEAKTADCKKDMSREGLDIYRDGDFIRAKGTTLGGDDGVALAYAMAVLDSNNIEHPDFEAVFTSDEEIGLLGAVALAPEAVNARLLINIDSDEEGVFTVGCAGGVRSDISLPVSREVSDGNAYSIELSGFKGGHSGVEINKGRANAIKALCRILLLSKARPITLTGGNADNAIPRFARTEAVFDIDMAELQRICDNVLSEYKELEPCGSVSIQPITNYRTPLTSSDSEKLLNMIDALPTGVVAMSSDIPGLVETSLNLGIVTLDDRSAQISFSVRSAKGAEKAKLCDTLRKIAKESGADYGERGAYPAWEYRSESHLRDVMVSVYKKMYGSDPEVVIIHAGLECGIFSEKLKGLDCVSLGPNNLDIHTTEERLSISSFARVWDYLLAVLKEI